MKKEFVFLFVASLAQLVTANEEWMEGCHSQSEKIVIHSADGNWKNFSSDVTSHQHYGVYRRLTCIADPDNFSFVRINHMMDSPSETKTISCGSMRKWLYKGEIVVSVGCFTGPRANRIQKPEKEEKIRNWMAEYHRGKNRLPQRTTTT
ncbi:unnamed protein product, partial [Mesorhabditis belari]|uniref:Uncharacterized protein n=1 Tax=Mesorhabditis belari TaxID=2138241 RepID=A0AAF3F8D9_9BILA